MGVIYPFFHNGQCNFPLVQFLLHQATSSLVQFSTFKHDDIPVLKTSMGSPLQHSHMMTFLYLKVDNGQCKFSIGWVSPSPHHFNLGSVFNIQVWYLKHFCMDIHAWWPFYTKKCQEKSIKIGSHIYMYAQPQINCLGDSTSRQKFKTVPFYCKNSV